MAARAQSGCEAAGAPLQCRLNKLLALLETTAGILAIVLVVVIAVAVSVYRRNKNTGAADQ